MPATLVTGASGFLGKEILQRLLVSEPHTSYVVLLRASDDAALARRRGQLVRHLAPGAVHRVLALRGDLARPDLRLSPSARENLLERVDRVLHVAASTRFDHPLEEARRRNVGGTAGILALCHALRARGKSGRLDYVSTAFVAGDRRDVALEDELDVGQTFRNTYEQSKLEAEALCRAASADLPIAIYRPSIVVGDSGSGATDAFKALYWPIEMLVRFYDRWRPVLTRVVPLPLRPDCSIDLVPVDWVASAVAALYERSEAVGRCYHLAAGGATATVRELVDIGCAHFGVPRLRYLDRRALLIAERGVRSLARLSRRGLLHRTNLLLGYAAGMPRFDTSNSRAAGFVPPPVDDYFERLIAYAYATDFGRRPLCARRRTEPERPVAVESVLS